jgi:16S rRNA G1207 methylase RsmC
MARRAPTARVWAVDVNARARALCQANAVANDVGNVRVAAPEDVPGDLRFATIWSNPPIRIGKPALHQLLVTWLSRLERDGTAVLVVHKHLGSDSLQSWLTAQGYPTERLASSSGYRILEVRTSAPG